MVVNKEDLCPPPHTLPLTSISKHYPVCRGTGDLISDLKSGRSTNSLFSWPGMSTFCSLTLYLLLPWQLLHSQAFGFRLNCTMVFLVPQLADSISWHISASIIKNICLFLKFKHRDEDKRCWKELPFVHSRRGLPIGLIEVPTCFLNHRFPSPLVLVSPNWSLHMTTKNKNYSFHSPLYSWVARWPSLG